MQPLPEQARAVRVGLHEGGGRRRHRARDAGHGPVIGALVGRRRLAVHDQPAVRVERREGHHAAAGDLDRLRVVDDEGQVKGAGVQRRDRNRVEEVFVLLAADGRRDLELHGVVVVAALPRRQLHAPAMEEVVAAVVCVCIVVPLSRVPPL